MRKVHTTFPDLSKLIVEGSVISPRGKKHSLSVGGDLLVKGNLNCLDIMAGGCTEIEGSAKARFIDTHSLVGRNITAKGINAWAAVIAGALRVEEGDVDFVECERISHGPSFNFVRLATKVTSRYGGNGGAANNGDVIMRRSPKQ